MSSMTFSLSLQVLLTIIWALLLLDMLPSISDVLTVFSSISFLAPQVATTSGCHTSVTAKNFPLLAGQILTFGELKQKTHDPFGGKCENGLSTEAKVKCFYICVIRVTFLHCVIVSRVGIWFKALQIQKTPADFS